MPLASASDFGLAGKEWHNKGYSVSWSVFVFVCVAVSMSVSAGSRENFPKTHVAAPSVCVFVGVCVS